MTGFSAKLAPTNQKPLFDQATPTFCASLFYAEILSLCSFPSLSIFLTMSVNIPGTHSLHISAPYYHSNRESIHGLCVIKMRLLKLSDLYLPLSLSLSLYIYIYIYIYISSLISLPNSFYLFDKLFLFSLLISITCLIQLSFIPISLFYTFSVWAIIKQSLTCNLSLSITYFLILLLTWCLSLVGAIPPKSTLSNVLSHKASVDFVATLSNAQILFKCETIIVMCKELTVVGNAQRKRSLS